MVSSINVMSRDERANGNVQITDSSFIRFLRGSAIVEEIGLFAIWWDYFEDIMRQKRAKPILKDVSLHILENVKDWAYYSDQIGRRYAALVDYAENEKNINFEMSAIKDNFGIIFEGEDPDYCDIKAANFERLFESNRDDDKLKLLFLITKKTRNNMFHGMNGKQAVRKLDGMRELFNLCADTIDLLVQINEQNNSKDDRKGHGHNITNRLGDYWAVSR